MAMNFLLKRSGTASKRPVAASMALGEIDLNYDAATGGLYYKDSAGNVVKVGPCQVSSTAPNVAPAGSSGNSAGEFWYDTVNTQLKLWNGSSWVVATPVAASVSGVTGTSPVSVNNTDPKNPVVSVNSASTTAPGVVQLATDAEVQAGVNTDHAVVPSSLQSKLSDSVSTTSSTTIASSTAVKSAYDAGVQGQTDAATAQSTADAAVPDASYTAIGDILAGTGAGTYSALALGTNGDVLTADSACASGVKWAAAGGGGGGSPATPTVAGLLPGCADSVNYVAAVGNDALLSLAGGTRNTALGISAGCSITTGSCNVAVGSFALCSVTTTNSGTAVGHCALWMTTGDSNTAIGERAGRCITTGVLNTAVGRTALEFTCGGSYNSGVGVSALRNACGSCNAAVGYQAGFRSDCDNNVFFGTNAGANLITGASNVFLGYNTGFSLVSGNYNVIIGANVDPGVDSSCCLVIGSGLFNWLLGDSTGAVKPAAGIIDCAGSCGTAGQVLMSDGANAICWGAAGGGGASIPCSLLTAKGQIVTATAVSTPSALPVGTNGQVLYANSACTTGLCWGSVPSATSSADGLVRGCTQAGGSVNTALGIGPLQAITTGGGNVLVGCGSGRNVTSGNYNVTLGYFALRDATTDSNNVSIGKSTLLTQNGAAGPNVAVGDTAGTRVTTGACNTFLGTCTGCNVTTGSTNVVIGHNAQTSTGTVNNEVSIFSGSQTARFAGSAGAWSFVSDARDKTNVTALSVGLDFVNQLQPRKFTWEMRDNSVDNGREAAGFIAQEVLQVEQDLGAEYVGSVYTSDPDRYSFAAAALIPVMVKAIQELSAKNVELEARLAALES